MFKNRERNQICRKCYIKEIQDAEITNVIFRLGIAYGSVYEDEDSNLKVEGLLKRCLRLPAFTYALGTQFSNEDFREENVLKFFDHDIS
jgi:hypothetical protein